MQMFRYLNVQILKCPDIKMSRYLNVLIFKSPMSRYLQGVPKKVSVRPIFEFQTLGGVFLGVKNNSKNFENKKNSRFFSKILSNWTLFSSKSYNFLEFL